MFSRVWVISGALLPALLIGANAAAAPTVAGLRSQAAKLAAAGKMREALERIREARSTLKMERRKASGAVSKEKVDPRFKDEMHRLALSSRAQWQKGPHTPERRRAIYDAFNAGRARLQKKYNVQAHPAKTAQTAADQRKVQAGFDLRDADLEDVEAGYIAKAGNPKRAQRAHHHASLSRVKAQIALGNAAEAEKQGAKLLAATPEDPDAYQTIAELYQSHRKFKEAVTAWEGGIKLLTTGTGFTSGQRTQSLGLFYRQLAFAYSRTGRQADADAAMKRAQSIERGGN